MSLATFQSRQIAGNGIGTTHVVSTINLAIPSSLQLPFGVYASQVTLKYGQDAVTFDAALHYGPRPTATDLSPSLEVHILDIPEFASNYNQREISVEVLQWIREIQKFGSFAQLKDQIGRDVQHIRTFMEDYRKG